MMYTRAIRDARVDRDYSTLQSGESQANPLSARIVVTVATGPLKPKVSVRIRLRAHVEWSIIPNSKQGCY